MINSQTNMSDLQICNAALIKLGITPIKSFDEKTMESLTAKGLYNIVKQSVLSAHTWSFATYEAELQNNAQNKYQLPNDFLRAITALHKNSKTAAPYEIQGNYIISPFKNISLQYIACVEDENLPPYFLQALIARLAADFCLPLIDSTSRMQLLYSIAQAELQKAKAFDTRQNLPKTITSNILLGGRA